MRELHYRQATVSRHRWMAGILAAILVACFLAVCAQVGRSQDIATRPVMPDTGLFIQLNIPAFRVDVRRGGEIVGSYTVAVGMRQYPTPTGDFQISHLVWNPWWNPPPASWARNDSVTPPGPQNPMGRVKLSLGSTYFLHGTPAVSSLGKAASHGCIRMHNRDAVALGLLVDPDRAAVDHRVLRDWSVTRSVDLPVPVPVRIVYELAEVRDSQLVVYADIYRRAGGNVVPHVVEALQRAGIDSNHVRLDAVVRHLQASNVRPARIPLHALRPDTLERLTHPLTTGG